MSEANCLVCQEHAGVVPIPGGFLIEDDMVVAFHCPPLAQDETSYLGHLFVTPRRHVPSFAELEPEEAARMGVSIAQLSRALKSAGSERVHLATIGHGVSHLHVHLLPRWPGTPSDVPWHQVDEWDGARRGDAAATEEMTRQLHDFLSSEQ